MKYDFSKLDKKTIAKGLNCKTVDELKEFVKTNNISIPEDKVEELFVSMNGSVQSLSDEALEKVAGGGDIPPELIENLKNEMRNGNKGAAMALYDIDNDAYYAVKEEIWAREGIRK